MVQTINQTKASQVKAAGFILCGFSVALGAFAAHALESEISERYLNVFETGVKYQFYHGLALLILGAIYNEKLKWTYRLWLWGNIIFSVSLYFLSLNELMGENLKKLGAITPIGGLLMITGWILGALYFLRKKE